MLSAKAAGGQNLSDLRNPRIVFANSAL